MMLIALNLSICKLISACIFENLSFVSFAEETHSSSVSIANTYACCGIQQYQTCDQVIFLVTVSAFTIYMPCFLCIFP